MRSHTNAYGALPGAKLIQFLKNNGDRLRELYPHDQISMMGAVARDAEAGARWRIARAVKGGADSVENLLAAAYGGMGAAALTMMSPLRQGGIRRTSDLYMAALADPELARALISMMPASATAGPVTLFARQLRRTAILGPMAADEAREKKAGGWGPLRQDPAPPSATRSSGLRTGLGAFP